MQDDKIVVGLDIGSTKVCVVAGRKNEYGKIEILGAGKAAIEEGVVRAGVVTKIDRTTEAMHLAITDLNASMEGQIDVQEVNINIGSVYIKGSSQRNGLTRRNTQDEIGIHDVMQLNDDMTRITPPLGTQILHVLPQKYRVDGESGVKDPIGMLGVRLDADFYVINAHSHVIQNVDMCTRRLGLEVGKMVFSPLASGLAVLSEDEKEQGVVVIDMGGGSTDIVIYQEGIVRHVAVIPFGGEVITRDIAHGCGITRAQAEQMKIRFGVATPEITSHKDRITVPALRDRQPTLVSMKVVAQIIEARLTEIIELVYAEIVQSGYESRIRNVGIVLSGGTAAMLHIKELFEQLTGMPVRIGYTGEHLGMSRTNAIKDTSYATAVGLVLAGFSSLDARENRYEHRKPVTPTKADTPKNHVGGLFGRIRTWLSEDIEDKNEY